MLSKRIVSAKCLQESLTAQSVLVIIPTYNERENIREMLRVLTNDYHVDVLVVDDASPDGTAEMVKAYAATLPSRVYLIERSGKHGLGSAYLDAYRWVMEHVASAQTIIQMDADFSHDPSMIPLLISYAKAYGVVVGSRYVSGGATPDWNWGRFLLSVLGNTYMKWVLRIFYPSYKIEDSTAGFVAWRRDVLERVLQYEILGSGYAFQTSMKVMAFRLNYPAIEIPIIFRDRRLGASKLNQHIIIETFAIPWRLGRKYLRKHEPTPIGSSSDDVVRSERGSKSFFRIGGLRHSLWWPGTVLFALICTLFPYWIWGMSSYGHLSWRIPVAPRGIFDTYTHLQQIGLLKAGINTGAFNWFAWPLVGLIRLFPSASIPEIWILSRWVVTFLLFWVGAWSIQNITNISKNTSRWLIICFWLSFLLVIGLRPGVFSWYMPFGYLGLAFMGIVANALREDRRIKAGAWTLAALLALMVYPWFLIYGTLCLAALWATYMVRIWPRLLAGLTMIAVTVIGGGVVTAVAKNPSIHLPLSFAMYERNGVMFSHLPLISNTVVACLLWLWLLLVGRSRRAMGQSHVMELLSGFWIVVVTAWLSPPLVGVFFENDHFIIVVAMLSWLSMALYVTPASKNVESVTVKKLERRVSLMIACFSTLFFLYVLMKGLHQLEKIETYTIHLSIWLSLAWSSWFAFLSARGLDVSGLWRKSRWVLIAVSLSLGAIGLYAVVKRDLPEMPGLEQRVVAVQWIQKHVPVDEAVCSDPVNASIYGAHDARQTYPEEANVMLRETDGVRYQRLITIGSAYDVVAAGDEGHFPYLVNGLLSSTCEQGAGWANLLGKLHISQETIDAFTGCQQERADASEREVMSAIKTQRVNVPELRAVCPWVIIPDDYRSFWHLPDSYREIRVDKHVSIWHAS